MSAMLKSLGLENAPLEVRPQLMEELWESIAREPEAITLTDVQKAELDRRNEEHEKNAGGQDRRKSLLAYAVSPKPRAHS